MIECVLVPLPLLWQVAVNFQDGDVIVAIASLAFVKSKARFIFSDDVKGNPLIEICAGFSSPPFLGYIMLHLSQVSFLRNSCI